MDKYRLSRIFNIASGGMVLFIMIKSWITYRSLPTLIPTDFDFLMRPGNFGDRNNYLIIVFLPLIVWALTFIYIDKTKKDGQFFRRSIIRISVSLIMCTIALVFTAATMRYI